MEWNLLFFFNSALLGVGLAMDAIMRNTINTEQTFSIDT